MKILPLMALVIFAGNGFTYSQAAPESAPASRPAETPSKLVEEYVRLGRARDYRGLAECFSAPLDQLCRTLARYLEARAQLVAESVEKFGPDARAVVEDKKAAVFFTAFESVHINSETVDDDHATVRSILHFDRTSPPIPADFLLVKERGRWRITSIGGKAPVKASQAESWILEWGVAAEAEERTLDELRRGIAKAPKDVPYLRSENLKRVTEERTQARQAGQGKGALPAGHAPLVGPTTSRPFVHPQPPIRTGPPASAPTSRPAPK